MGELMMAETRGDEIEIGKSVKPENIFKTSISFGRFENDLLSWERWSSFSQNKYLEEVEKCSTPGSVAEKKAYFEAHYKKIAARKAELEEEQKMDADSCRSDSPTHGNPISNGAGTKLELNTLDVVGVTKIVVSDSNSTPVACRTQIGEHNMDVCSVDCQGLVGERVKEEVDGLLHRPKSTKLESTVLVKDEKPLGEPQVQFNEIPDLVKEEDQLRESQVQLGNMSVSKEENDSTSQPIQLEKEVVNLVIEDNQFIGSRNQLEDSKKLDTRSSNSKVDKAAGTKSKPHKESQEVKCWSTPERTKKKPVTSTPKIAQKSLPRVSKPATVSPVLSSTSRNSTRKDSSPSLLKNKSPSAVQSKRSTPSSLHMSLSLGPSNSDSASPTMTRRSFIMESMGDKDIVKRAFRTFRNSLNLSKRSNEETSSVSQQVSTKGTEQLTRVSMTPRKDKEGVKKAMGKADSQRGQVGGSGSSISARSVKAVRELKTSAKVTPSTLGLKSDEKAQKQKELSSKLQKPNMKELNGTRLQSTPKVNKEAEIKKLCQTTIKTTQTPNKNRGLGASKIHATKEEAKMKSVASGVTKISAWGRNINHKPSYTGKTEDR